VGHPISSASDAELEEKAREVLAQSEQLLFQR